MKNKTITQKSVLKVHKIMLDFLNDFEVGESKFYKLTSKIERLGIAIPAEAYTAINEFIRTSLEPIIFTDQSFDEFQAMRTDAKAKWGEIVDKKLRTFVAD